MVAVFGLCWAPFHVERLLWSSISHWTDLMHQVYQYVHIVSGFFFYLSSAVNPIIYSLLSTRFRERFRELVCSRSARSRSSGRDSKISLKDPSGFIPLLALSAARNAPAETQQAPRWTPR